MSGTRVPVSRELWPEIDDCYACSPTSPSGIGLEGFEIDRAVVAEWTPKPHHTGWPGIVHGGVVSTVFDEITGWAATIAFRRRDGVDDRPIVTAGYEVRFLAPLRPGEPTTVRAEVTELTERKASVAATIAVDGDDVAACTATYVRLRA
jgi:acyl-coenzyme A thioesterase PaaI-like protein